MLGIFSKAMPSNDGPLDKSSETPSHCTETRPFKLDSDTITDHDIDVLVQVLARGKDRLGRAKLEIPQPIFHPKRFSPFVTSAFRESEGLTCC